MPVLERMFVYRLIDPRDGSIFYIGSTENVERRKYEHEHTLPGARGKKRVARIHDIQSQGLQPVMNILTTLYIDVSGIGYHTAWGISYHKRKMAEQIEQRWMNFYRDRGIELTNNFEHKNLRCYCRRCDYRKIGSSYGSKCLEGN